MKNSKATIVGLDLVNIKYHKGHDGMSGLNADIKYKGKKIAHVYDDARGGGCQYDILGEFKSKAREENSKLFNTLNSEVKKLPSFEYHGTDLDYNLDIVIDDVCQAKQFDKDKVKGIMIKTVNGYDTMAWKGFNIPKLVRAKNGLQHIQKAVDKIQNNGEEIINNDYLQSVGVIIK